MPIWFNWLHRRGKPIAKSENCIHPGALCLGCYEKDAGEGLNGIHYIELISPTFRCERCGQTFHYEIEHCKAVERLGSPNMPEPWKWVASQ